MPEKTQLFVRTSPLKGHTSLGVHFETFHLVLYRLDTNQLRLYTHENKMSLCINMRAVRRAEMEKVRLNLKSHFNGSLFATEYEIRKGRVKRAYNYNEFTGT